MLGGKPVVLVEISEYCAELAALVRWANDTRVRAGRLPLPIASELVQALRFAIRLAELHFVPHAEHEMDSAAGNSAGLTTTDAAAVLRITERGVRQRIRRGKLRAHRAGKTWLIAPNDLRIEEIAP